MSRIDLTIPHSLSREEATRRIEGLIPGAVEKYGDMIRNLEEDHQGDTWRFEFDFSKFPFSGHISGEMRVEASQIIVWAEIPPAMMPFQGLLEETIQKKAGEMLT